MAAMKKQILPPALTILERRCGPLTSISGQGIMRGERNQFVEGGVIKRTIIKASTNGRISFARDEQDWIGLDESDYIVVVGPISASDPTLMVSMFDKKAMRAAFDANYASQDEAGMGHLPNWIAPFHEEGRGARGVGDGFQDKAIWSEPLYLETGIPALAPAPTPVHGLTIEQAKVALART